MEIKLTEHNGKMYKVYNGTWYNENTCDGVIKQLDIAQQYQMRVRLFYGDSQTGRNWNEENDVTGTISQSMGPVKIPILLHNSCSNSGGGILDHCIVKMMINGWIIWQHPNYHSIAYKVSQDNLYPDLPVNVYSDDRSEPHCVFANNVANFRTWKQAIRWVKFMQGERMTK